MTAQQFLEQLLDDPDLRREFQHDPHAAATRAGAALDDNDVQALSAIDWSRSGQLRERMNMAGCGHACDA